MKELKRGSFSDLIFSKNRFFSITIFYVFLILHSCTSSIPHIKNKDMGIARKLWKDAKYQDLKQGRTLYVRSCSGCHILYKPSDYSAGAWKKFLPDMGRKANISKLVEKRILRYLILALNANKGETVSIRLQ